MKTLLALLLFAGAVHAQQTLRLVDWAGLDEQPSDLQALEAFRKAYPSIEVLYEPNPGRSYEEKILAGLAAGDPPDVILLDSKLIPTFTNKQVLLDLGPYIGELKIDTSQWFPELLDIARRGEKLYAFPKGFTPLMFYYNRGLFRELGVPEPDTAWTWDEFLETARRLTADTDGDGRTDRYGTAFTNYYFYWIPWVWTGGGDVVDPEGMRATGYLDSPVTEQALSFPLALRTEHRVAPDVGTWIQAERTGTNYQLFASGRIGMMLDGHWRMPKFVSAIREGRLDIGVVGFPRHPASGRKVNVMYESGWCVPVNARHPREAALLAAFMAGEEACRIRAANRLEIPANIAVAREYVERDPSGIERRFMDELRFCRQPWGSRIERFSEVEWILQDAVDEVMVNGRPLDATMTRYAAKADDQLANIRQHASQTFRPIREHSEILAFLAGVTACVFLLCALLYLRAPKGGARRETRAALGFLAPSLLHLTVMVFTPIVFAGYLSLHRWDVVVPDKPFVGGANFAEMFTDAEFWNALGNTLVFSLNVPVGMACALAVALLLHRRMTGIGILRAIYFLPSVTSFVAIALVWMWIYHPTFGAANFLLGLVGIGPLPWLNASDTAMASVMIFTVWMGLGYQMVIFLAGLQGIPGELYEAARVDGASTWQNFWRITLPMLKPTTFFILVTSLIGSFQVFTTVYVMTAGGPVGSTDVLVYHVYKAAWEQLRMGYAAAMSWVLFLLIMAATYVQFRLLGRQVEL